MRYTVFLFLLMIFAGCTVQTRSTALYEGKGGKPNTPYDDNRSNNKERRAHQKKARERQKEIDHIEHRDLDPSQKKQ